MTNAELLRIASAILWAESAARIFNEHHSACPKELVFARLGSQFSLDSLQLLRDELDEPARLQLDAYLDQVRAAVAASVPAEAEAKVEA